MYTVAERARPLTHWRRPRPHRTTSTTHGVAPDGEPDRVSGGRSRTSRDAGAWRNGTTPADQRPGPHQHLRLGASDHYGEEPEGREGNITRFHLKISEDCNRSTSTFLQSPLAGVGRRRGTGSVGAGCHAGRSSPMSSRASCGSGRSRQRTRLLPPTPAQSGVFGHRSNLQVLFSLLSPKYAIVPCDLPAQRLPGP